MWPVTKEHNLMLSLFLFPIVFSGFFSQGFMDSPSDVYLLNIQSPLPHLLAGLSFSIGLQLFNTRFQSWVLSYPTPVTPKTHINPFLLKDPAHFIIHVLHICRETSAGLNTFLVPVPVVFTYKLPVLLPSQKEFS